MSYTNYRDITGPDGALANLRNFDGNTMHGRKRSQTLYVVWSFDTEIAWVTDNGWVTVLPIWPTNTTQKHLGMCRAWLNHNKVWPERKRPCRNCHRAFASCTCEFYQPHLSLT